ncbi:MAG: hypothetical protein A3C36_00225 [Omnitrophica WOR_2 bacterium RIFCSPHIGHO2_02_FULL_52_10]|nr:MAG: hypothetical protein A3C36_00225 [Omnitrophica WOR_2 bacterium RIFCSPHIGHO2_02_FULL_52_10]
MNVTVNEKLKFERVGHYRERRYVPNNADFSKLEQITALYEQLLNRPLSIREELERWILDRSELESVFDQQGTILYILMTCQTDDGRRAQNYKKFIETIVPVVKSLEDRLNRKYLAAAEQIATDENRYGIYIREMRADIELFNEKNVALETKVELLSQEYQTICGAMTVEFDGREQTLPQMHKYLLEPDGDVRERAWRAASRRRLNDREKLDQLFEDMLALRHQIARNAGMDNFCDYKFKALHRFDYSPQDCFEYHRTVERIVVPLWRRVVERRREMMKLECLRPWDTSVDPLGRAPLKPFAQVGQLTEGCRKIFHAVNATLGGQFDQIMESGLLDLASRKGKAPGGYQSTLNESRKPFIFMNAIGIDSDVSTLLHEGGHAFHALACAPDPLLDYRHGPMEFNEVASMGMELLADRYLNIFYKPDDEQRSRQKHFEDIIFTLVWVATIDAFQHAIYQNPRQDCQQRCSMWLEIRKRFGAGMINWTGLEEEHARLWHQQLHVFEVPFYYIEYGIAQLGALQLWLNSKKNWGRTLQQYQAALKLGGSKSLPELFQAAGIRFDFSEKTIVPLMDAVAKELKLT